MEEKKIQMLKDSAQSLPNGELPQDEDAGVDLRGAVLK